MSRRALAAGAVGNVLEWYDFAIYGYLAPVIAGQFFPSDDPLVSLIAAFGVFAAGYLMRPVGALFIGHIGDRYGRVPALTLSIALMAIPTGLISVLPTHASIGVAAAILLTVLRLLQGVSVGGEYTGSTVFLIETAPKRRRGIIGSACSVSGIVGILLASALAAILTNIMSTDAFAEWGWRLAFVPGPILGIIGYILRRHLQKSNWPDADAKSVRVPIPIMVALRQHGGTMLRLGAITASYSVAFYIAFVYLTTYLTDIVKVPRAVSLEFNTAAMVLLAAMVPVFAIISDKVGRKPVMMAAAISLTVFAYPLFLLLHSENMVLELIGDFAIAIMISAYGGPFAAFMVELFPRHVRYSAVSVAYSLPVGVFGGSTPLVATWLIANTEGDFGPAFYMMAFAALGVVVLLMTEETRDNDLD